MNDNESKLAWLLALAADSDPARVAETHGVVIGLLVAAPGQDDQQLADQLAALQVGDWNSDRIQQQLGPAIATLRSELGSPDMDFRPLLPTDDRPLEERTHCLASWVTGFLAGYGTAGERADSGDNRGDAAEALRMLEQIARAGLDPDADDDIQEEALTELNEFVRVATLLLREERLDQSA